MTASVTAAATALSDTLRAAPALPVQFASASAFVRSAASDSTAWGSRLRMIPSVSTEMPPTAWLPIPRPWASAVSPPSTVAARARASITAGTRRKTVSGCRANMGTLAMGGNTGRNSDRC